MTHEGSSILVGIFAMLVIGFMGYKIRKHRQHLRAMIGILNRKDVELVVSLQQVLSEGDAAVAT